MRTSPIPTIAALILSCWLPFCGGCRRDPVVDEPGGPLQLPETKRHNQLALGSTAFLRRQANGPIHWQNWNADILDLADRSNRLVMLFLGSSLYPSSDAALDVLHQTPQVVATINENYVPVLADADSCRELGIFANLLSSEIQRPVAFPFLMWLSPDGNPIAWTPIPNPDSEQVLDLFRQSSSMVESMWHESPQYVRDNSRRDSELRFARLARRPEPMEDPPTPKQQVETAVRRLCSLYDPVSNGIDGTGGLPPAGVYELLSLAAASPALPAELRRECRKITSICTASLVHSSMIDPLDGGIYLARRGAGWNLPVFSRDTTTQCRMVIALLEAWRSTGDAPLLNAGLNAMEFAASGLGTGEGRVVHSSILAPGGEKAMLWTSEDLETILEPDEYRVLAKTSELRGLGNVPLDADPRRQHFRLNVLGSRNPPDKVAAMLGLDPANVREILQRTERKLRKIRDERLADKLLVETAPYARHHARLASARAAAFAATGDSVHRDRAVEHLRVLHTDYFDTAEGLQQLPKAADPTQRAGRAIDYALTGLACLDVYAVTLDPEWIQWAGQLVDLVSELFVVDDRLREYPPDGKVIEIPLADSAMVFEESTVGVLQAALARLSAFGITPAPPLATALEFEARNRQTNPIIHTDFLSGQLTRHLAPVIRLAADFAGDDPAKLGEIIRTGAPRRCTLVAAGDDKSGASTELPTGTATLGLGGETKTLDSPDALLSELRRQLSAGE